VDGLITGRRLIGGIQTVLMSTLGGGSGVGELGEISITDRAGNSATVDLSGAETLNEVLDAINVADIGIRAGVNASKTGIELTDTSGGLGNLIVADADATSTATNLGLLLNDSVMTVDSGDMHRQVFGEGTRLASINGGAGVATGSFTIIDATGREVRVAVTDSADTIGEAIREINRSSTTVMAEINETGDGIVLRDLTGSGGTIRVEEGSSTTAADLNLLGEATEVEIDGKTYSRIDGSMTRVIELDEDDTLTDLQTKINDLGMGVTAGIFSDGSSRPYRISLTSERSGTLGRMVIDTSGAGFYPPRTHSQTSSRTSRSMFSRPVHRRSP